MTTMKPLPLLLAVAACLGSLAGCIAPHGDATSTSLNPNPRPCATGYYVGCDDNPDAAYLLQHYGLHQITNATRVDDSMQMPRDPRIEGGLVVWPEGGFGKSVYYHAALLPSQRQFQFKFPDDEGSHEEYPSTCCMLYGATPDKGTSSGFVADFNNSTVLLWNPMQASTREIPVPAGRPFFPYGFDGNWALLLEHRTGMEDGLTAVNVNTKQIREVFPMHAYDGSYLSDHLQDQTVAGGSVFYSWVEGGSGNLHGTLFEVNLTTGDSRVIAQHPHGYFLGLDASPRYVVVPTSAFGAPGVWTMDRSNRTWWNLEKDEVATAEPKVGGDWCVFEEHSGSRTALVGVYIPTGKKYDLVPDNADLSLLHWDTDGQHLVVQLEVQQTTWAKYPSIQLYWMNLPSAG